MINASLNIAAIKTTSYKVVLPFYLYSAFAFLIATIILLFSADAFMHHYFHPHILAITHIMALGWATMVILGAGHQLVPVLIEGALYSNILAYISFGLTGIGIPLLVYGFYNFDMGFLTRRGGELIILGIVSYLINIVMSMKNSKGENVHSVFIFTATIWLLLTTSLGLLLLYNFTKVILPNDSLHYLPLHAHGGIIGWFLLLVIGVGSRLIPLFLISKYTNPRLLWVIYGLINLALLSYIFIFYNYNHQVAILVPALIVLSAIILFMYYCYQAYNHRLRKHVDEQVRVSLLSVAMMALPVLMLFAITALLVYSNGANFNLIMTYGFLIFFGWLTAIILGMTFKTLPFIAWNRVYRKRSAMSKTPSPKDLFNDKIYLIMSIAYIFGFIIFAIGIAASQTILLQFGAILLIVTAFFYNWNVIKVITHRASA